MHFDLDSEFDAPDNDDFLEACLWNDHMEDVELQANLNGYSLY